MAHGAASALLAFGLGGAAGWFLHNGLQATEALPAITPCWRNRQYRTTSSTRPTVAGRPNWAPQQRDDLARWVWTGSTTQWNRPICRPDGFSYMGGRWRQRPAGRPGLLMYDLGPQSSSADRWCSIEEAGEVPIQHVDFAHVDGCAWIDKGIGYTVVGKLPPSELRRIAEQVRQQLSGTT